jgi:hypothetical protein
MSVTSQVSATVLYITWNFTNNSIKKININFVKPFAKKTKFIGVCGVFWPLNTVHVYTCQYNLYTKKVNVIYFIYQFINIANSCMTWWHCCIKFLLTFDPWSLVLHTSLLTFDPWSLTFDPWPITPDHWPLTWHLYPEPWIPTTYWRKHMI